MNIELTTEEKEIFSIITQVVAVQAPTTTVRVVGGWTRDKLLGLMPNDIDLMVDNMTGSNFARLVAVNLGIDDPHIIKENPAKSRHVETAKIRLPFSGGVADIDVAMCRKEVYDEFSRVPKEVGGATPQEDAQRRDLTINALFYNLSTETIEDFTGRGLDDIRDHILRSPGNPVIRFLEDPLRIWRVARYAARLGWDVEEKTLAAMGDPEVAKMLYVKTSPDRMGEELGKMMQEPHPDKGLNILQSHKILEGVVNKALAGTEYEGQMTPWDMDQKSSYHDLSLWDHTVMALRSMMEKYPVSNPEKRLVMLLAALGHDLGKMFKGIQGVSEEGYGSYHGHEEHSREILRYLLKHLKLDRLAEDAGFVASMHMKPYALVDAGPKALRKFLRQFAKKGVEWVDVINMVLSDVTAKQQIGDRVRSTLTDLQNLRARIEETAREMESMGVSQAKPLLNGREIMEAFNNRKPGEWIGKVMNFVEDLVDTNPSVSKEEAVSKSRQQFPEFVVQTGV